MGFAAHVPPTPLSLHPFAASVGPVHVQTHIGSPGSVSSFPSATGSPHSTMTAASAAATTLHNAGSPSGRRSRSWSKSLVVVQYNVLADGFFACSGEYAASDHGGFNEYSTPHDRQWDTRFPKIMNEIDSYSADVVCLNEVQWSRYEDSFRPAFAQRGYSGALSRRDVGETRGTSDRILYSCIFVRDSCASIVQKRVIRFFEETKAHIRDVERRETTKRETTKNERRASEGEGEEKGEEREDVGRISNFGPNRGGPNRGGSVHGANVAGGTGWAQRMASFDREALLLLLEHRGTGKQFVAVSTHLHSSPAWPDVKAYQASMLCRGVVEALQGWGLDAGERAPVVVCADLNSQPRDSLLHGGAEGAYALVTAGTLPSTHPDHPATDKPALLPANGTDGSAEPRRSRVPTFGARASEVRTMGALTTFGLRLRSAMADGEGKEPPLTTKTRDFEGTLDYIFVGGGMRVTDRMDLPYVKDGAESFGKLPNAVYPSDHIALVAQLYLL
jgi:mRNA deadenylase 3'-5' endonuclease subunit Ccr4